MEAISYITQNYQLVLVTVLSVIGGASVILRAIAPLTKNKIDDKALTFLGKAHKFLSKLALTPPPK